MRTPEALTTHNAAAFPAMTDYVLDRNEAGDKSAAAELRWLLAAGASLDRLLTAEAATLRVRLDPLPA